MTIYDSIYLFTSELYKLDKGVEMVTILFSISLTALTNMRCTHLILIIKCLQWYLVAQSYIFVPRLDIIAKQLFGFAPYYNVGTHFFRKVGQMMIIIAPALHFLSLVLIALSLLYEWGFISEKSMEFNFLRSKKASFYCLFS